MSKRFSEEVEVDSEEEEIPFKIRKNLTLEFERREDDRMQVFLRIRPFTDAEEEQNENQGCLEVEGEHNVLTHAPKTSHSYKNCAYGLQKMTNKYTFSKIYGEDTTQKEFFNGTMLGIVKNFIDGQNCLVFSYGVTSSGKTYTIQGEPRDAGILPRALDVLFNSISCKQQSGYDLKPAMFMDVVKLTKEEAEEERKLKGRTLKLSNDEDPDVMSLLGDDASDASQLTNTTTCSESSNTSFMPNKESLGTTESILDFENRVREETRVVVEDQGQILFSVWVSFAEIYNEQIFDLLQPISKKKNARRPVLRLSEDRNGSPYIKGLKEVCVQNADEAYKLLTIGKRNLQTACTKLNHQSSRSHCIFNIKIIRVVDKANPRMARVSMLSFCDLAGSERSAKTQSVGDRLKEAGNINTSLMTLGRCIEMLRFNQNHKENPKIIPFRDSKLTRLFQNFFCGQGRVNMIVNVNQCASMFDETHYVFKFSAIAKQVVITQKAELKTRVLQSAKKAMADNKKRAVSISWATPGQMREMNSIAEQGTSIPLPGCNDDEEEDFEEEDLDVEELLETIKDLQSKLLKERRDKLRLEMKIREEVCSEMKKQLVEIEDDCSERIRQNEEATEEMYEKRIQILMDAYENQERQKNFMTDEEDEWVSSILYHQEKVRNQEKSEEIAQLKKELKEAKIEQEQVQMTGQATTSQSLEDIGDSVLLETLTKQLDEVKTILKEKDNEIKDLNEMLTEAGETFQAKEKEIQDLKNFIAKEKSEHEQQMMELGKALSESKKTLEMADQKIKSRDDALETTRKTLQDEVNTLKTSLTEKEDSWKMKFEKEEEESLKREQALINGYKAEIANLKNQLSGIKAEHRHNSPIKSPSKHKKHQDHFMEDLSKQLKDLQEEFDKNSAATLELEEALHKTKQTNEELEEALSKEKQTNEELEEALNKTKQTNEELQDALHDTKQTNEEALHKTKQTNEELEEALSKEKQTNEELEEALNKTKQTNEELQDALHETKQTNEEALQKEKQTNEELEEALNKTKQTNEETLQKEKQKNDELQEALSKEKQTNHELQEALSKEKQTNHELQEALHKTKQTNEALQKEKQTHAELQEALSKEKQENQKLQGALHETKQTNEEALQKGKQTNEELQEALNKTKQTNEELQEALNKTKQTNEELQEAFNKEKQTNEEALHKIKQTNEKLEEALSKEKQTNEELEEALNKTKQTNGELQDALQKAKQTNGELQEALNKTKSVTDIKCGSEEAVQNQEKIVADDGKLTAMEKTVAALKCKIAEKDVEIAELKEQANKLDMSIKRDNQFQLDEANIEISQLQGELAKLERKAVNLEKLYKEKTKQNMELNDELNKMKVAKELLEEDLQDQEETEGKLVEISKENDELKKRCDELEKETKQHQENSEKNVVIQKENCEQCQEWQTKNADIEKALEALKEEVRQLQGEAEPLKEQLTTLRSDLQTKGVEVGDLEKKYENIQSELEKKGRTFEETLEKLEQTNDQYDELKQRTEILNGDLQNKNDELERLKFAQADMMEQLNSTNDQVHELSEAKLKFAEMKSSLHMQKTLYEKAKADLVTLKEEKNKLLSDEKKWLEQIESLENKTKSIETDKEEHTVLQAELADLKTKFTASEEKLKIIQEEKSDLEKKCEEIEHQLITVSTEKQNRSDELVKQVCELESKLQTAENSCEDFRNRNVSIQAERDDLSMKLGNVSQEKEKLLADLQCELQTKCTEFEEIIADLKEKISQKANNESNLKNELLTPEISSIPRETKEDSCTICPAIQKELDSSHDREQTLKKQLQTAGENIEELNNKICDLEDQVSKLTQREQEAEASRVHQEPRLSIPCSSVDLDNLRDEVNQKMTLIQDLQREVMRKDTRLQTEKMKTKQLMEERSNEQRRYEAALKDATANEECIAVLKTALSEQEETMEHQDMLIQQHEKNIEKIQKECEKYMTMYQSLLSSTNTNSVEIRDLSRKICDLSVENERIRSEKKEFENKILSLKKQEAEHQQLAQENLSLRRTQNSVQDLEEKLGQVREEKKTLQTTVKSMTSQVESLQQEKQCLADKLGKIQERDYTSDKRLEDMAAKLSDFESNYNKRENDFKAVMEQKGKLEAIVKENNSEIKELEKLLSETRAECEDLKSDAKKQISEQLSSRQREHEEALAEMKIKIRERDHSLRDSNKQIRSLEIEIKNLVKKSESKDDEMKTWKEEKDKLVSALSEIIEKQKEDKERVQNLERENSRLETLLEDQVETIRQLTASGSSVRKSKLRNTSMSSDVSSKFYDETPLKRTSTRRGRKRRSYSMSEVENPASKKKDSDVSLLSEDVGDDRARIHIDATPPVAAKNLRRTRRKPRSSTDLLREEAKDSSKAKVDVADKENKTVKRIGSLLSALKKSPISRSAKKNLAEIKELPSPNQNLVEVEDCGTQMSAERDKEPPSRKKSRRHALYKEPLTISEPLDCGQFIHTTPEENIHDTVQKRLRRRPRK